MITAQTKLDHAHRLMRTLPPAQLKAVAGVARREGRWAHVDWKRVADPTPPPPGPICPGCKTPLPMADSPCVSCRRKATELQGKRAEETRRRAEAQAMTETQPANQTADALDDGQLVGRLCRHCKNVRVRRGVRLCEPCREKRRRRAWRDSKRRARTLVTAGVHNSSTQTLGGQ